MLMYICLYTCFHYIVLLGVMLNGVHMEEVVGAEGLVVAIDFVFYKLMTTGNRSREWT